MHVWRISWFGLIFFGGWLIFSSCSRPPEPANTTVSAIPETPVQIPTDHVPQILAMAPRPPETPMDIPPTPVAPPPVEPAAGLKMLVPAGHVPSWLVDLAAPKIMGKIEVVTYQTEAEFREKFAATDAKYQLVSVSDRLVAELISHEKLAEWPRLLNGELPLPQAKFLHHYFDPANLYAWPYAWTWLGAAIVSETFPNPEAGKPMGSWKELSTRKKVTASEPTEPALKNVAQRLLPTSSQGTCEVVLALDNLNLLKAKYPESNLLPPPTPLTVTLYHWAIVKDAASMESVQNFLRFACLPENAARLATENHLSVTQSAALKLLTEAQKKDPNLYPPDIILDRAEFVRPQ